MIRSPALLTIVTALVALVGGSQATAQQYDIILRGGTVYDGSGGPPVVADVAVRGDAIAAVGDLGGANGTPRDRRPRPGRRPRVHQHAELGARLAPRRRPVAERHPPGGDARGLRRGRVLRPLHRCAQGRGDQAAGRHPLRDHLGLARRVPRDARATGRLVQRGVVRRGGDRARVRRRVRRPRPDVRRAGPDAHPRGPRHDRGGTRCRLGPDLRPRLVRPDRRAGGDVRGRRAARRDVHQPPPQRGRPASSRRSTS